ncbi:unnamed protein product [Rhodiola kirilowii]
MSQGQQRVQQCPSRSQSYQQEQIQHYYTLAWSQTAEKPMA